MISISIVITSFNRPNKCISCINAILKQDYLSHFNHQLIIIDDMRHLIELPVFNQFKDDLLEHLETNK